MDKLKYIKLKNEDGSYTDSIPLAVDSDHVDVNGSTLTTKLGTLATKTEVQAVASGSPAGVYATVSDLITADPDRSKIYLVNADGHWYYYNNGWTDGGLYQAARTLNDIDVYNLIFGDAGKQLYNRNQIDAYGYYKANGTFSENEQMEGTYIPLNKIKENNISQITVHAYPAASLYCGFCDINKNGIANSCYAPLNPVGVLTIPTGAEYFYVCATSANKYKFSVYAGNIDSYERNFKKVLNATIDSYEENKYKLDNGINPNYTNFIHEGANKINMNSSALEEGIIYTAGGSSEIISKAANDNYSSLLINIKPSEEITITSDIVGAIVDGANLIEVFEYDKNMEFIYPSKKVSYNATTGKLTKTFITNSNTKYLRLSWQNKAVIKVYLSYGSNEIKENYTLTLDGLDTQNKKPYESGFIQFSVPVNQTPIETISTADKVTDNEDIINAHCALKLPTTYTSNGKPSKLLMICHGAGKLLIDGDSPWINNSNYNNLVNAFNNAGYVVFDCNGPYNDPENDDQAFYGTPQALEAWKKAYTYVVENYNVEKDFCIYGFSMGGLTALNLINNNMPNVKAVGLGSPVIDMSIRFGPAKAKYFSSTITTYSDDLVAGYNPILNIVDNKCIKQFPPIKMWFGSLEDGGPSLPVVNKQLGINLTNAIKASNGTCYYREVEGAGHEICYGHNSNVITEIVYWLNRF